MRILLCSLALLLCPGAQAAEASAWSFRVLLDGREIGRHRFTLVENGAERHLRSEANFAVRVLFVKAYRYAHRAEERWRGDCLQSLVARTQVNGALEAVDARVQGSRLVVERGAGREEHPGCQMSFAYWNPAILEARRLLHAQTGELVPVRATALGTETFVTRGRAVSARRHRLEGPGLAIDLWYVGNDWVGLESTVEGGRRLRYELA